MVKVIQQWFHRYFSDPQAVLLVILLATSFTVILTMGKMLAPLLVSLVLAYLLEGTIQGLQGWRFYRLPAVLLVFSLFTTIFVFILLILLPLLANQISQLFQELPAMVDKGKTLVQELPKRYPNFISEGQVENWMNSIRSGINYVGQHLLSGAIDFIPAILTVMIYFILVPILVFFFLKDKELLLNWLVSFLPQERHAASSLWKEMDAQMGNYVRGKVYEIFIVGTFTYIPFAIMGLNYASLLAVLVGLSVIIPYIGAVVVTIPVILVAYFQWGFGPDFGWLMVIYLIIQAFDGNVLVPLLFSEAVNLHPIAIISAVLVFGGLWGFWGVFFAIPLATLVKALITTWPRSEEIK